MKHYHGSRWRFSVEEVFQGEKFMAGKYIRNVLDRWTIISDRNSLVNVSMAWHGTYEEGKWETVQSNFAKTCTRKCISKTFYNYSTNQNRVTNSADHEIDLVRESNPVSYVSNVPTMLSVSLTRELCRGIRDKDTQTIQPTAFTAKVCLVFF